LIEASVIEPTQYGRGGGGVDIKVCRRRDALHANHICVVAGAARALQTTRKSVDGSF
jgi:hypothetical protein